MNELGSDLVNVGLAMACFLASKGAELKARNHHRKLALDLINDSRVIDVLKKSARFVHKFGSVLLLFVVG